MVRRPRRLLVTLGDLVEGGSDWPNSLAPQRCVLLPTYLYDCEFITCWPVVLFEVFTVCIGMQREKVLNPQLM